ncbi:hypothetical protein IWW40_000700 [Coemansia sp. RSA 1250]|nr:hypothetical protein IWW40_000700 [Coemansia sp. RSA 1250]
MDHGSLVVAVHIGAGYHSTLKEKVYKSLIKKACLAAMQCLKQSSSAGDAVERAIQTLEDSRLTNAGQVECDASMMCSNPDAFGAVGAVTTICNPIQAAHAVMKAQGIGPDPQNGLVPPMLLVGHGAEQWAEANNVATSNDIRHLITPEALDKYARYMDQAFSTHPTQPDDDILLDTVGAVCIDSTGVVAAGVSSGGIALKYPGRVGEAAMFGCGCWAQAQNAQLSGCSVSGTGEQISRLLLAKLCAQKTSDIFAGLDETFAEFCTSSALSMYVEQLGVAHTTASMGYGFMTGSMKGPKARVSRKQKIDKPTIMAFHL